MYLKKGEKKYPFKLHKVKIKVLNTEVCVNSLSLSLSEHILIFKKGFAPIIVLKVRMLIKFDCMFILFLNDFSSIQECFTYKILSIVYHSQESLLLSFKPVIRHSWTTFYFLFEKYPLQKFF